MMRTGLKLKLSFQYLSQKVSHASLLTLEKYETGQLALKDVWATGVRNTFTRGMIYLYRTNGSEMEPTVSPKDTLVVRKLPYLSASSKILKQHRQQLDVGDVVVLKDPMDSNNHIVRRLAAVGGYEMASTNEDDKPFVIEDGQCWVLSDNNSLQPKEFNDSRTYGPISMSDIVGRVIYRYRTFHDNGLMVNSKLSMIYDMPVLYIEVDGKKLQQFATKGKQTKSS
ncbi:hypothetical protein RND81_05G062500 [Saponaria officinalis]|uniref:Peptidase S26 domain-containing protein n=1 Tax=Saponaria officinalis TaxID=3572 RepID=A0AAW1KVD9_SAPOF